MNANHLTDAQTERLAILSEEAGEVIQVIGKILRHGFKPIVGEINYDNTTDLEKELGDLYEAVNRLVDNGDISIANILHQAITKTREPYLHHQK